MTPRTFIHTNFDLCTGCNICQLACSMKKEGGFHPASARLLILRERENLYNQPVVCNHCENPYCANVCPSGAIARDELGAVVIDHETCIGCGLCADYCPLGMCRLTTDGGRKKSVKCDLCGGAPECVKSCPTGALVLVQTIQEETK